MSNLIQRTAVFKNNLRISTAFSIVPDPRLAFLHRAHATLVLVDAGELDVDTAIGGLIEPFEELVGPLLCACSREIVERWERDYPRQRPRRR
jgi:hypothetical protein